MARSRDFTATKPYPTTGIVFLHIVLRGPRRERETEWERLREALGFDRNVKLDTGGYSGGGTYYSIPYMSRVAAYKAFAKARKAGKIRVPMAVKFIDDLDFDQASTSDVEAWSYANRDWAFASDDPPELKADR